MKNQFPQYEDLSSFNKLKRKNTGKPHFGPDLGMLGPNLGHKYFLKVSALLVGGPCPKLQSCAISRKTNNANLRKWQKTNFRPNFGPFNFFFVSLSSTNS